MSGKLLSFLLILFMLLTAPLLSGEREIVLEFSGIEKWLNEHSPELKMSAAGEKLNKVNEFLNSGLPFSNPEFSFKNESLKSGEIKESEHEIEVSKSFTLPWIYSLKRKGWKYHKLYLELSSENFRREFFVRMKSGYIELVLLKREAAEYETIGKILNTLLKTAEGQEREGFLSTMNLRMIRIALSNMKINALDLMLDLEDKLKSWKQSAGIELRDEIKLVTGITYVPVSIQQEEQLLAWFRSSPGYRIWEAGENELKEKIAAEKLGFLPDITLSAGYKKVEAGPGGMTMGFSFALPVLNRNSLNVKRMKFEMELHRDRSRWALRTAEREIEAGYRTIEKFISLLEDIDTPPVHPSGEILPLIESYKEGTISVTDMISGIQLHLEGMTRFHSALNQYYSAIFKLEKMIGKNLVTLN